MEDANKFYEWMLRMGNIHLADSERMVKAYDKVINNN